MKLNRKRLRIVVLLISGLVTGRLGTYSERLFALPTGGNVVGGEATIGVNQNNSAHQIITQASDRAIINWQSFNIAPNEMTQFIQPSSSAIVLNRVVGGDPSSILGTLKANGQVWIINPAGILFGRSAVVDVAGLVATTANISNQNFMNAQNHKYLFSQDTSGNTVINEGSIKIKDTGIAALVAPGVRNSGVIVANLGKVVLGSGTEYTLDFYGDNLIHFAIGSTERPTPSIPELKTPNGDVLKDAVSNPGQIIAEGGKIILTTNDARRVVENLINMDGIIKANTAIQKNGEIILLGKASGIVKVTGKIEAKGLNAGQKGGEVKITGEKVGLFDKSLIDVSGMTSGGNVFIGGEFKGGGALPHADAVYMQNGAKIKADALSEEGKGGLAVLWSKKSTRFHGDITAKGGNEEASGGTIEISGGWFENKGKIDPTALNGKGGFILFDPWDVDIIPVLIPGSGAFSLINGVEVWLPNINQPSQVFVGDIINFLNANISVEIQTTIANPPGVGPNPGDIVVAAAISPITGTATLSLFASNFIQFNADVTGANLSLDLRASLDGLNSGFINSGNVSIVVAALSVQNPDNPPTAGGFPRFEMGNPPGFTAIVGGRTDGSNITLLNFVTTPGAYFFNHIPLFRFPPSPTPPSSPTGTINQATNPNNLIPSPLQPPNAVPNPPQVVTPPTTVPTPPTTPPAAPSPSAAVPSTPTPSPTAPNQPSFTPSTNPISPPTAISYSAPQVMPASQNVPAGSDIIGGFPEFQECSSNSAAASGGVEGSGGNSCGYSPEAQEKTEQAAPTCPPDSVVCALPTGPVTTSQLETMDFGPNSLLGSQLASLPVGPDGINGFAPQMGAAGIGEGIEGEEKITTAYGAGGEEGYAENFQWDEEETVDHSYEYLENIAPKERKLTWFQQKYKLMVAMISKYTHMLN